MLIGLIEMPVSSRPELILPLGAIWLMESISSRGLGLARLELDAGVKVFRVLADDDQVDRHVAEKGADAGIMLAGADAGEQPQLLPQVDVDAAEAGAHWRGDGGLQAHSGCGGRFLNGIRKGGAKRRQDIDPRLLHVPVNFHAGRIDALPGGLGQFRSDSIAQNQRDFVCHRWIVLSKEIIAPVRQLWLSKNNSLAKAGPSVNKTGGESTRGFWLFLEKLESSARL